MSFLRTLHRELDRGLADLLAEGVLDGELQRVLAIINPLRDVEEVANEEVAARVQAMLFRGRKVALVDALPAAVQDLIAAAEHGVIALVGGLALEVLDF